MQQSSSIKHKQSCKEVAIAWGHAPIKPNQKTTPVEQVYYQGDADVAMEFSEPLLHLRSERKRQILPLASEHVAAGFPSPAEDYIEIGIDLNEQLIRHPASTFFLRVSGHSMTGVGIHNGDLLVVDRSLDARPGHIVVAILDGAFTLKQLVRHRGVLRLEAAHSNYPPLDLARFGDVQIWGVAVHSIHSLNPAQQISHSTQRLDE